MTTNQPGNDVTYIVILNYKNWQETAECLESVFAMKHARFKVLVADNDSQNQSLEQLAQWADRQPVPIAHAHYRSKELAAVRPHPASFPPLVLIQNEHNNGFSAGNNVALRLILQEDAYVWLLNPDMTVQENTLAELLAFAGSQPFNSITGAVVKNYAPPHKIHLYGGGRVHLRSATISLITREKDIPSIEYISGGALLTHTRHFRDIGLLPEDYFLYWEETAWCFQARQNGYAMRVCMTAVCYDKISTTIGRGFLSDYYYTRNGLIFVSRHDRKKIPLALYFAVIRFMKRVLTGKWKRARGVYKGTMTFLHQRTS